MHDTSKEFIAHRQASLCFLNKLKIYDLKIFYKLNTV